MRRALIVDDEMEIRAALASYYPWADLGFVVAGRAACASEARAAVEAGGIDVVLCDIRMPGESGLEFAAWLSAAHPRVKLVLLSAFRNFEYAQEAFRYGVKGYLVKPPSEEEFRSVFGAVARELEAEAEKPAVLKATDPALTDVYAYLCGNPGEACLKAAARAAGMNPTYFSAWFKAHTGSSFSRIALAMRMEKAAQLIAEERRPVAEVGKELGYSNPKNFSRAFRLHFGASPRAYRRLKPSDWRS